MERQFSKFKRILSQNLPEISAQFDVDTLEIFGSYVRGQQNKNSDLDLLVTFKVTPGLFRYIQLENYLSDLLGVKVDLVMRSALKPNISRSIIAEAVSV
jgi:predicted nucleotidyltransferase